MLRQLGGLSCPSTPPFESFPPIRSKDNFILFTHNHHVIQRWTLLGYTVFRFCTLLGYTVLRFCVQDIGVRVWGWVKGVDNFLGERKVGGADEKKTIVEQRDTCNQTLLVSILISQPQAVC